MPEILAVFDDEAQEMPDDAPIYRGCMVVIEDGTYLIVDINEGYNPPKLSIKELCHATNRRLLRPIN